jgi:hypothetical protein
MNTYFVDYSTRKSLAVAVNRERPCLVTCSLYDFVSGKGTGDSASGGQEPSPPSQAEMFSGNREKGKGESITMGKGHPSPSPGDIIVIECNFEPHSPEARDKVIDYCQQENIDIKAMPIRQTGKIKRILDRALDPSKHETEEDRKRTLEWVEREGLELHEHDDLRAVEAIRWCYYNDITPSNKPKRTSWENKTPMEIYQTLRTSGGLTPDHPWVQKILRSAPTFLMLPPEDDGRYDVRDCYFQDGNFSLELLIPTVIMTDRAKNREEFDRLMGLYNSGYPSSVRSSFVRRAITLANRESPDTCSRWKYERHLGPEGLREVVKEKLRLVRRATRKMRREILLFREREGLPRFSEN